MWQILSGGFLPFSVNVISFSVKDSQVPLHMIEMTW